MIIPQKLDLYIYQGSTYDQTWQLSDSTTDTNIDLNNCTGKMEIRENFQSEKIFHTITTDDTTELGHLTLTPAVTQVMVDVNPLLTTVSPSTLSVLLPANITKNFPYKKNNRGVFQLIGYYDIKIHYTLTGIEERLLYGKVVVDAQITQE